MPSPFPGMDPYLESPELWPDVHHGLISEIQAKLNQEVRPRYHVRVENRVYISDENDPGRKVIIPDLRVAATHRSFASGSVHQSGQTAVAQPVVMTTLIDDEIHEAYLEVVDTKQHLVITVIEILSPTNKIAGSRGRASYEQKRREVMMSPSHFVEIDLLRAGEPIHTRELLPPGDYFVHVSQKDRRPKGFIWPIALPQQLPVIGIPLKPEDPNAPLNLQAVLETAYDRAAYDLQIDYSVAPKPPLSAETAPWAVALLAKH